MVPAERADWKREVANFPSSSFPKTEERAAVLVEDLVLFVVVGGSWRSLRLGRLPFPLVSSSP